MDERMVGEMGEGCVPVWKSMLAMASSRMRILDFLRRALAKQISCFCP